jgi:hypothetical protein
VSDKQLDDRLLGIKRALDQLAWLALAILLVLIWSLTR